MDNWMWHAVRAFFEEGGKRLYVVACLQPIDPKKNDTATPRHGFRQTGLPR